MSTFFSSRWFLEASADTLHAGSGARPGTVEVSGLRFDTLLLPNGLALSNPMSDFLEPRASGQPALGTVLRVRSLPRVALERVAVSGPSAARAGVVPSPCIDWRCFDSWDAFVSATAERDWRAFKITPRKRRKLARSFGPVRLELDVLDHDLVELALAHKARQLRRTGGLDRFASRRVRQLVHRLVEERHLTLSVLFAGERPVAFALAHWAPRRLFSWIVSYDPEAAAGSPGTQLYEGMMRASWDRGHEEFDFLIGAEPYKYHYATHERLVGPLGRATASQRVAGVLRRALEADARPRRLRSAARGWAVRAAQARLAREDGARIDDVAFRDAIESRQLGWPG
jgi:hypothetical protein